jgi:hypothetical protein
LDFDEQPQSSAQSPLVENAFDLRKNIIEA